MTSVENTTAPVWDRFHSFYNDEVNFERDVVVRTTKMTFFFTGIIGGFMGRKEAERRLQVYTTGVTFGSPSLRVTRGWDYKMLTFMKNSFRSGIRSSILIGTITMATTHLTIYKQRYSGWYAPTISASASGVFALPLGIIGSLQAGILGTIAGLAASGSLYLYALYINGTIDDAYKRFKEGYEKEIIEQRAYQRKVIEVMKEQNLWLPFKAYAYLNNKEADEHLGNLDDYDDTSTVQTKK